MSDSLVLTGVKDVRKHTGTEMVRRNPRGGGDTFNVKRWWIAGGVSTCYEPCTVFDVTTAAGTVKLALATKAEDSRVRIDHDGSFNFTFIRPGAISRACLFTDAFEVIEHYVFPSISGGKVMIVTPSNGADRPTVTPPPPAETLTGVTLTGPTTATDTETETYSFSATGTASDISYLVETDEENDVVTTSGGGADVTFNGAGDRVVTVTASSNNANSSVTDDITVTVN